MLKLLKKTQRKLAQTQIQRHMFEQWRKESLAAKALCLLWLEKLDADGLEEEGMKSSLPDYLKLAPMLMKWHQHEMALLQAESSAQVAGNGQEAQSPGAINLPLSETDRWIIAEALKAAEGEAEGEAGE